MGKIICLDGNLSGGKTAIETMMAYDYALEGKKVIANYRLDFPKGFHTVYMSNDNFVMFLKSYYQDTKKMREVFGDSVLCLDEIYNLISARQSSTILNEFITNWCMMIGKLNCILIMTSQIISSQMDVRLRAILNVIGTCNRVDENGKFILSDERKLKQKIFIRVDWLLDLGNAGVIRKKAYYDPSPYFSMYDTEELVLMDRSKYLRGGSNDLRGIK